MKVTVAFLILILFVLGTWVTNLAKLNDCDFISPYRCEVVHGLGLFGPIALVTVWFETDNK